MAKSFLKVYGYFHKVSILFLHDVWKFQKKILIIHGNFGIVEFS